MTQRRGRVAARLPRRQREAAGREAHPVGAEEPLQDLGRGSSFDGVPGVVVRDGWGLQQRGPGRVGDRRRVAVDAGEPDRGDRPPEAVVVLRVPGADVAVRQGQVQQAEQPRALPEVEPLRVRDRPGDAVPRQRRALDPEQGDLGLVGRAVAGSGDVVAAEALDLVDVRGVLAAGQRVRRAGTELRAVLQHEGREVLAQTRRESERGARRVAVLARGGALLVVRIHGRGVVAVLGAQGQDRCGSRVS